MSVLRQKKNSYLHKLFHEQMEYIKTTIVEWQSLPCENFAFRYKDAYVRKENQLH